MYARWLDDGLAAAPRESEKPLILKRRQSGTARSVQADKFDPLSEDVLRRYRSYAVELAALAPTS